MVFTTKITKHTKRDPARGYDEGYPRFVSFVPFVV